MSLEDTELKIGGTTFRGVYIAILLSLATTLGTGVWTASSLYSRLQDVESRVIPNIEPIQEQVALIEQQLSQSNISGLQGDLATLGTNLETIMERQTELLQLQERVVEVEKAVKGMEVVVERAELSSAANQDIADRLAKITKEIDSIWEGMDYLANPLN